jgi:hypothetical protein
MHTGAPDLETESSASPGNSHRSIDFSLSEEASMQPRNFRHPPLGATVPLPRADPAALCPPPDHSLALWLDPVRQSSSDQWDAFSRDLGEIPETIGKGSG